MTSRNLHRQPAKRMLRKVRKLLQGDMVQEGETVLVDFDQCRESREYSTMADFITSKMKCGRQRERKLERNRNATGTHL